MKKKILAILLCTTMFLSTAAPLFATEVEQTEEVTVDDTTEETIESTSSEEVSEEINSDYEKDTAESTEASTEEVLESVEESETEETIDESEENNAVLEAEMQDTKITISGDFPSDAELTLNEAAQEKQNVVNEINEVYEQSSESSYKEVYLNKTYEINVESEGEQWQPDQPVSVAIDLGIDIPSNALIEVYHIMDDVNDIKDEIKAGEYESYTSGGLNSIFSEETIAAKEAGCTNNTVVYEILSSSFDQVKNNGSSQLQFELSSFSTINVVVTSETHTNPSINALASVEDKNALALDKNAEKTADGYELTLEAYGTGEEVAAPVDVVFVVDQSTSMFTVAGTDTNYTITEKGYSYSEFKTYVENHKDLVAQEGYFVVRINDNAGFFNGSNQQKYSKYYADKDAYDKENHNGDKFYVIGSAVGKLEAVTDHYSNTAYTNGKDNYIWMAVRWNTSKAKLEYNATVLQSRNAENINNGEIGGAEYYSADKYWLPFPACADSINKTNMRFYQTIYGATYDAMMLFYEETKNIENCQVAIVGFSEGGGIFGATSTNAYKEDFYLKKIGDGLSEANANDMTSYIKKNISTTYGKNAFAPVGSTNFLARIKNINPNYYGTVTDAGLGLANYIFKNGDITGARSDAKRYVILYTDGNPVGCMTSKYTGGETKYSNQAIKQAHILKDTYDATVYSIAPTSGVDAKYLSYISSEYPEAESLSVSGSKNTDGKTYAIAATSTSELSEVFSNLARTISQTSIELGKTTVLKDVISHSFTLPEGATKDDITVYTSEYNGTSFESPEKFVDAQVEIDGRTISVTNFDYAENYVSNISRDGFYGKKLIIKIPIVPNPDFLGGNDVPTNTSDSGIYSGDACVEYFPIPKVDVDVSTISPLCTSKDIYISQQASLPDIIKLGEYNQNDKDWKVDSINNEYVNIVYTITDPDGMSMTYTIPAGTNFESMTDLNWSEGANTHPLLKEDTQYTVTCTVTSKTNEENTANASEYPEIQVYKPVITYQDSAIELGTVPKYSEDNYVSVVWKHGDTEADVKEMGASPTLKYDYDKKEAAFTEDTPVKVEVTALKDGQKVPEDQKITSYVTFYRDACDFEQCTHTTKEIVDSKDEDRVNFVVHVKTFDLIIQKDVIGDLDDNQSFIFKVTGPNSYSIEVMIYGEGAVTIKDLTPGEYTIEEIIDWSWRYEAKEVSLNINSKDAVNGIVTVEFENTRTVPKWLSGDCYAENWWGPDGNVQRMDNN